MDEVVPINWIHLSSDRKKIIVAGSNESPASPTGLLLFTVEPLGDGEGALGNYNITEVGTDEGNFPGPLTYALPVFNEEGIPELAQKGLNRVLNSLQRLIDSEIEEIREVVPDYKNGFEFGVEPLEEELIKNHPDAIMGVLCTDGGNVEDEDYDGELPMPLYRVWIMLYRWVENEEGEWTWR